MALASRRTAVVLIIIGGLLIATAAWYWTQRSQPGDTGRDASLDQLRNEDGATAGFCGDGICQDVACLSTDCPEPESAASCPDDCATDPEAFADGTNDPVDGAPTDETGDEVPASLDFSFAAQSSDELRDCPVEEANLAPSDAVDLAQASGLTQGTGNVDVRLYRDTGTLAQCVWSVRSTLRPNGGSEVIVVDATQDVLPVTNWGNAT